MNSVMVQLSLLILTAFARAGTTEVEVNSEDKSYPTVGTFLKAIAFFWDIGSENDLAPVLQTLPFINPGYSE